MSERIDGRQNSGPDTQQHSPTFQEHHTQEGQADVSEQSSTRTWQEWNEVPTTDTGNADQRVPAAQSVTDPPAATAPHRTSEPVIGGPLGAEAQAALDRTGAGRGGPGTHQGAAGSQSASQGATDAQFGLKTRASRPEH